MLSVDSAVDDSLLHLVLLVLQSLFKSLNPVVGFFDLLCLVDQANLVIQGISRYFIELFRESCGLDDLIVQVTLGNRFPLLSLLLELLIKLIEASLKVFEGQRADRLLNQVGMHLFQQLEHVFQR